MKNKLLFAISFGIIYTILALILFSMLFSCSAKYHFTKFIAKGGKIDTTERIIEVKDTIRVNGKDSIITLRLPFNCPSVQIPPTRLKTRLEYRLKHDSIKTLRYITKWKTKEVVKVAKSENKKPFNWFWIGLAFGLISAVVIKFVIKKL